MLRLPLSEQLRPSMETAMTLSEYLQQRVEHLKKDLACLRTERAKARLGVTRWAWTVERAEQDLSMYYRHFDMHCTSSISEPDIGKSRRDTAGSVYA